eukprot:SAG31_NODE_4067_length_3622_cov_17.161510_2_plen_160_part_00
MTVVRPSAVPACAPECEASGTHSFRCCPATRRSTSGQYCLTLCNARRQLMYWGLGEEANIVSAWIAIDDSLPENGCMRFVPGTHKTPRLPHGKTDPLGDNLLSVHQVRLYFFPVSSAGSPTLLFSCVQRWKSDYIVFLCPAPDTGKQYNRIIFFPSIRS